MSSSNDGGAAGAAAQQEDGGAVRGILKHAGRKGKRDSIRWDEGNLALNEEEKVPRMKIDEPPTPYNAEYDPANDEEEDPVAAGAGANGDAAEAEAGDAEAGEWDTSDDEDGDGDGASNEKTAEEHAEFERHRKAHYRMGDLLKRRKLEEEDEDDDDE